ncbi:GntR family transcriptional regulator [Planctomicrobium sp. SH661]|uniref:GntR family transcriptional regulator n=1 Tax=Planctomicrobium sp. SH661 TaxID=3448124 RepID=UPI003F5C4B89
MKTQPVHSSGLRYEIARQILQAICRGELAEGERLIVKRIAAEFEVSSTPAREALLELASVGAVDLHPNKGAVVRRFGWQQIEEIYDTRRLLEVEAVRLACGKLPVESLKALRVESESLLKSGYTPHLSERAVRCDRELHSLVARCSGQGYLAHEISRIAKLITAARGLLGDFPQIKKTAIEEHLVILEALLANRPVEAMEAMRVHIKRACRYLLSEVFPGCSPESRATGSAAVLFGD